MKVEEAIEKAVEGGYSNIPEGVCADYYFLDPSFWQSLGKAMGLDESRTYNGGVIKGKKLTAWECLWHNFINHLASGKDIPSFFETL